MVLGVFTRSIAVSDCTSKGAVTRLVEYNRYDALASGAHVQPRDQRSDVRGNRCESEVILWCMTVMAIVGLKNRIRLLQPGSNKLGFPYS